MRLAVLIYAVIDQRMRGRIAHWADLERPPDLHDRFGLDIERRP
jgi:hypothetical protein